MTHPHKKQEAPRAGKFFFLYRDALLGQVVGDLLVAPALLVVEPEDGADDVRLCGDHLELLLFIDKVAVGSGTDPLAVGLPPSDDIADLFTGVGDGHLVDEELELDLQPVIVVGEVDVVPNGDDPDSCIPQVLQLYQSPAVPSGEPGEIFDDENGNWWDMSPLRIA